jgi:phosphoglycolate phosphatase
MKAIGVETCIYVGDSEVDVQTAKNAGVPCLSVLWGFRDKACLTEHGATHFCEDPKDLLRILKEMTDYGK